MKNILLFPFLLGLCVLVLPAQAQVYKWVDANGKTQYGDAPPESGRARADILKTGPTSNPGSPTPDWQEKDREFRRRQIEKNNASRDADPQDARSSQQLCFEARARMNNLDGKLVYRLDKNGQRVYMEDNERAAIEKNARQAIAQHCSR